MVPQRTTVQVLKRDSDWRREQVLAGVVVKPSLVEKQKNPVTGEERFITIRTGDSTRFAQPLGFTPALGIDVLSYVLLYYLPRDMEMAERIVEMMNETLRRIIFYLDEAPDGTPVLQVREYRPSPAEDADYATQAGEEQDELRAAAP